MQPDIMLDIGRVTLLMFSIFYNRHAGLNPGRWLQISGQGLDYFHNCCWLINIGYLALSLIRRCGAKQKRSSQIGRILKPGGFCILLWNLRINEASPLMGEYETLLNQYGTDYREIAAHKVQEEGIRQFFAPNTVQVASFPNQQKLDKSGFLGRLLSVSYLLEPEHPRYEEMIQAARSLFDKYQRDGYVEFFYHTKCYYGGFGELRSKK